MTIIAIGWTRGNKKALATILPTKYWEKLRNMPKFDYADIADTHKIMKRSQKIILQYSIEHIKKGVAP
jgi:hypothetical protein